MNESQCSLPLGACAVARLCRHLACGFYRAVLAGKCAGDGAPVNRGAFEGAQPLEASHSDCCCGLTPWCSFFTVSSPAQLAVLFLCLRNGHTPCIGRLLLGGWTGLVATVSSQVHLSILFYSLWSTSVAACSRVSACVVALRRTNSPPLQFASVKWPSTVLCAVCFGVDRAQCAKHGGRRVLHAVSVCSARTSVATHAGGGPSSVWHAPSCCAQSSFALARVLLFVWQLLA